MLTLESGNSNALGKPNVFVHVPASYRAERPLHVVVVFHGFENCLESFVSAMGLPCRPGGDARTGTALAAQLDRTGTGAITIVPQLAYDEKSGDPGVLTDGPALERLVGEALGKTIGRAGPVERVAMIAISGGYQPMYTTLPAFGDRVRDVFFLDAYYAEEGPVDRWLFANLADFARDAARPRRLGVIYTMIEGTQRASRGLAARVLATGIDAKNFLHNGDAHDVTIEELRNPIAIVHSNREHEDVPRVDLGKAVAASGI